MLGYIGSIGLTISGIIFLSMIGVISFSKKKYNNVENVLFRTTLILTISVLTLEFFYTYAIAHRETMSLLCSILCRLYLLLDIIIFILIIGYTRCLGSLDKYTNIISYFKSKFNIFLFSIGSLFFIISCFMKMTYYSGPYNQFYVIGGPCVQILYVLFGFFGIYMIYLLIANKNKVSLLKRVPLILFLVLYAIFGILQIVFKTDINDLTYLLGVYVIMMYFSVENQDTKVLEELEVTKKEAEIADREKTRFLSNMSHEIRTPMNTIMGFSESLLNKADLTVETLKNDVNIIYISANNLLEIINNILDVSRLDSNKESVYPIEYSVKEIVYELYSSYSTKIDQNNVKFNINVDKNIPSKLEGDRLKIYKVISNIISNSCKYTKTGIINLSIDCTIDKEYANFTYTIEDTGIGIKKDDFDKIFKYFSKIENNYEYEVQGTGLGLVITKKLVDLLNGTITFESDYGVGTKFTINLRQKIVDSSPIGELIYKNENTEIKDYSNHSVLVVDDNDLNLKLAVKLLQRNNFKIDTASSGKECIDKVKKNKYDLILMDHMMPEMDGIETYRVLKKLKIKSKVVAMTANIITEDESVYKKEGFDGFISKPMDIKSFNKLINKLF